MKDERYELAARDRKAAALVTVFRKHGWTAALVRECVRPFIWRDVARDANVNAPSAATQALVISLLEEAEPERDSLGEVETVCPVCDASPCRCLDDDTSEPVPAQQEVDETMAAERRGEAEWDAWEQRETGADRCPPRE